MAGFAQEKVDAPAAPSQSHSQESDTDVEAIKINEKSLLRKIDIKLLPAVALLYLLSFLDRSNVGNARLEGLTTDLKMTGNQYLTSLTLYFIGYVIFEVPCNIILKRTTPQFWLPTLTLLWGIVATLMGVTQNLSGFFAVRFFLGVAESGLFPGVVYYFSMWYKRTERQYRVALFFSMASLAGAFGGIFAYGIAHMRGVGGYAGWRWIFIIEGLLTVVLAVGAYGFVKNYPATATGFTQAERDFIVDRLKDDSDAVEAEVFHWGGVKAALTDPKCWLYGLVFHTLSLPLYTLSLFLPTIIRDLGYTAARAQLLTVPPYALATLLTVGIAIISERAQKRAIFVIGSSLVGVIGYALLLSNRNPTAYPAQSYVGTFFAAAGIYPAVAVGLSWPSLNVSGQTKRATATAMQISIGNLGAVIGTQLYRPKTAPRYLLGHGFALGYLVANMLVVGTLWWVLKRDNARKERLVAEGKTDPVDGQIEGDEKLTWRFSF